ncbi:MAG: thiamine-monophosphate kinase, partial [Planctomycetota bacterium]
MTNSPAGRGDEDARLADILPRLAGGGALSVGPGDDCAQVDLAGNEVVLTSDVLVDGVHFELLTCGPEAAGAKALLVNLSDLAAAGARPRACEVGVVLPRGAPPDVFDGLARGLGRVARTYRCPVAGGDTNVANGPLVVAVTAIGLPPPSGRIVTRRGAVPGDVLSVTGPLGGSPRGRHLDFVPRLAEAGVL